MITNREIKAAITRIAGQKKQKFSRIEVFETVRKILIESGLMVPQDGKGMTRQGVLALFGRNIVLAAPGDGEYKMVPLLEGTQGLEVLIDGMWRAVRVVPAEAGSKTKTKLDVADDVAVIGLFARLPFALSGTIKPLLAGSRPNAPEIGGKRK